MNDHPKTILRASNHPLRITVLGATGFTGQALVTAAAERGHHVTAVSRGIPAAVPAGVTHRAESVLDEHVLESAVATADVVLSALSPRGELLDQLASVDARLVELAGAAGVRVGLLVGSSSLRPAPGAPRIAESDDLPPEFAVEARQMLAVLVALEQLSASADWFFVSPSMGYGAHTAVEARGTWRVGGDVASFDPADADLSAADFAGAVLDEVEQPAHHRSAFSVIAVSAARPCWWPAGCGRDPGRVGDLAGKGRHQREDGVGKVRAGAQ